MRFFLAASLLLFSCAEPAEHTGKENVKEEIRSENLKTARDEYWICHHPGTDFHDQECVEKSFPEGCYVHGDLGKFCWLIYYEDCIRPVDPSFKEPCRNLGLLK
tara:strand:- start:234 stop:545 length:312 start_codon:yes stop_codon:yes gene_type:complete